jgi:hypothetical protein
MKIWEWFKAWLYHRYIYNPRRIEDLIWTRKEVGREPVDWAFADTVDFDIAAVKTTEEVELIAERVRVLAPGQEVQAQHQ